MRAFQDKIKTMGLTVEKREGVTGLVRKVVNAKKEFLFEEYKKELFDAVNEEFIGYFNRYWVNITSKWADWMLGKEMNRGVTTTNHLESYHGKIQNGLFIKPNMTVYNCVRKLYTSTEQVSRGNRELNAEE